jgi:FAD/FMN-containing dehydrogenase
MEKRVTKEQLAGITGAENVLNDREALEAYSKDESFMPSRKPFFVVKPGNASEVQAIVKIANVSRTPVVPVSSGPPHFRGDTVPEYGGIVVDLSRMKTIRFVDRQDRVAMIEPGVRFAELRSALKKEGLKLPTPLRPRETKSVVASFLEREPHTIPKYHLDHTEPLLCAEVIFGTGDIFGTGEAAGPGTIEEKQEVGWRQKLKLEPQTEIIRLVQGSQGTMGIVTWATVRCEVMPSIQKPYLATGESLEDLLEFAYRLARSRIGDELLILNAKDFASVMAEEVGDIGRIASKLPKWLLFFSLSGYRYFPEERIELQERGAKDTAQALNIAIKGAISGVSAEKVLAIISEPSSGIYWKLREKGGCQDISFIASYNDVPKLVGIMEEYVNRHGFPLSDVGVYVQPVCQGHAHHCEFSLFYDRGDVSEKQKAHDLYLSLGMALMANGAFFSRPYDLLADHVFNRDAVTRETLKKIKSVFDPSNILNPGKLCF